MANLIIFSGSLAAGKSTISKLLGETFNYIVLNKDEYKIVSINTSNINVGNASALVKLRL